MFDEFKSRGRSNVISFFVLQRQTSEVLPCNTACRTSPCRARSEPGGTRWRTGGEVKGKMANGVGSQYSHATFERRLSSITQVDAHSSAASSRLNWRPRRFKWTRPFRGKTKSGFCLCAITFRTSYNSVIVYCVSLRLPLFSLQRVNILISAVSINRIVLEVFPSLKIVQYD